MNIGNLIAKIGVDSKGLDKGLGQAMGKFKRFGKNTKALGRDLTKSLTVPILGLAGAAVKSAADLETLQTSFVSLTGGAKQAADMVDRLNAFAANTPFQLEDIGNAARQLLASGSDIGEVNDQLQFLGDIAATSQKPIGELSAIFAKVNAKGKVELESLNQLAERGIPIFTALSEATGLPADKLGAGAVSVEQFNAVLKSMAEEGGFAAGAMQRLSQTAAGKFSTALDNLKQAGANIGRALLPSVNKLLDSVTSLAKRFANMNSKTRNTIVVVGAIAAAIGPLLVVLPQLAMGFTTLFAAITGPVGLTIMAVAALTAAFLYFFDDIAAPMAKVINFFISAYNESEVLRVGIALTAQTWVATFKGILLVLRMIVGHVKMLGQFMYTAATDGFGAAVDEAQAHLAQMDQDVADTGKEIYESFTDAVDDARKRDPIELVTPEDLKRNVNKFKNLLTFGGGSGGDDSGVQPLESRGPSTTSLVPTLILPETATEAAEAVSEMNTQVATAYDLSGDLANQFMFLGEAIGGLAAGTMTFADVGVGMLQQLGGLLQSIGAAFISAATAALEFYATLIANPVAAIGAGVALVAAGAVIKGLAGRLAERPPQLADGGIAFGRSLVEVGEYSGARANPEVIAPLDKLQGMLGNANGGSVQIQGVLRGEDIYLATTKARTNISRSRGSLTFNGQTL